VSSQLTSSGNLVDSATNSNNLLIILLSCSTITSTANEVNLGGISGILFNGNVTGIIITFFYFFIKYFVLINFDNFFLAPSIDVLSAGSEYIPPLPNIPA